MNEKKGFLKKVEHLLSGKGFYMVLLLCLVILGAAGFFLYRTVSGLKADPAQLTSGEAEVTVTVPADAVLEEHAEDAVAQPAEESRETEAETGTEDPGEAVEVVKPAQTAQPADSVPAYAPAEEESVQTEAVPEEVQETSVIEHILLLSWPVEGDVVSAFSDTELLYNAVLGDWRTHNGIDIAADLGTEVRAAADGTVVSISSDPLTGTTVTLSHEENMTTTYGNLDPDTLCVAEGDTVTVGETLACVGTSASGESSSSPYIHFAVSKDGKTVDPTAYLLP